MANYSRIFLNYEQTDLDPVVFNSIDEQIPELEFDVVDPESVKVDRQARAYSQQHNVSYTKALTALGHTF